MSQSGATCARLSCLLERLRVVGDHAAGGSGQDPRGLVQVDRVRTGHVVDLTFVTRFGQQHGREAGNVGAGDPGQAPVPGWSADHPI